MNLICYLKIKFVERNLGNIAYYDNDIGPSNDETPVYMCMCYVDIIVSLNDQGAVSIRKTVLPGMAIPMLKIRRPNGRLIFNMEITIRR